MPVGSCRAGGCGQELSQPPGSQREVAACSGLLSCLGPWPSLVSCSSVSRRSIALCCRTAHACGMEALQMISPFLELHICPAVVFCGPVFALSWPSGLRKPPTVSLFTCQVNPEPFLLFYHHRDSKGRRPFTAQGPACPGRGRSSTCPCYPVTIHPSVL